MDFEGDTDIFVWEIYKWEREVLLSGLVEVGSVGVKAGTATSGCRDLDTHPGDLTIKEMWDMGGTDI